MSATLGGISVCIVGRKLVAGTKGNSFRVIVSLSLDDDDAAGEDMGDCGSEEIVEETRQTVTLHDSGEPVCKRKRA